MRLRSRDGRKAHYPVALEGELQLKNVIAIGTESDASLRKVCDEVILIPDSPFYLSPILSVIPLQMLAYHIANELGCDVDKPRNLAKSVTVE